MNVRAGEISYSFAKNYDDAKKASGAKAPSIPKKKIDDLPDNAKNSYKNYEKNEWEGNMKGQTPGTKAGGSYNNRDGKLPSVDKDGNLIFYEEFDVNNKLSNAKRDSERFVRGSDGSIYYTNDHYDSFFEIEKNRGNSYDRKQNFKSK